MFVYECVLRKINREAETKEALSRKLTSKLILSAFAVLHNWYFDKMGNYFHIVDQ